MVISKNSEGESQGVVGWEKVDNKEMQAARVDNAPEKSDFEEEATV